MLIFIPNLEKPKKLADFALDISNVALTGVSGPTKPVNEYFESAERKKQKLI